MQFLPYLPHQIQTLSCWHMVKGENHLIIHFDDEFIWKLGWSGQFF